MEMEGFYNLLSRKSVLNIINSLAKDKPLQFKDIKSGFGISDKTTFKITSELLDMGLIKKNITLREGKHVDVYELTELGKEIHSLLEQVHNRFKKEEEGEGKEEEEEKDKKQEKKVKEEREEKEEEERRELTTEEKERIHIIIEKITTTPIKTIQEKKAKELYEFAYHELEQKTYWYTNKELLDFIQYSITGKYPYETTNWLIQLLYRIFIDIRKDEKYYKRWFRKVFPLLQYMLETPSNDFKMRLDALRIIEDIRDKNGNLLIEVLEYLFNLHRENYKSEYFNTKKYGLFYLDKVISDRRTIEEQRILEKWIEERLENPKKYDVDEDLKKEYDRIFRRLAKME